MLTLHNASLSRRALLHRSTTLAFAGFFGSLAGAGCGGGSASPDSAKTFPSAIPAGESENIAGSTQAYSRSHRVDSLFVPGRGDYGKPGAFTISARGNLFAYVTVEADKEEQEHGDDIPVYLVRYPLSRWKTTSGVRVEFNGQWGARGISPITENNYLADISGNFHIYSPDGEELLKSNPWGGFDDGYYASGQSQIAFMNTSEVLVFPYRSDSYVSGKTPSVLNNNRLVYRFDPLGILQATADISGLLLADFQSDIATRGDEIYFYQAATSSSESPEHIVVSDLAGRLKRRVVLADSPHNIDREMTFTQLECDASGNFYVVQSSLRYSVTGNSIEAGDIRKFSPRGEWLMTILRRVGSLQCDPLSADAFYVSTSDGIERYERA